MNVVGKFAQLCSQSYADLVFSIFSLLIVLIFAVTKIKEKIKIADTTIKITEVIPKKSLIVSNFSKSVVIIRVIKKPTYNNLLYQLRL
jgi:hypothetical protein